MHVSRTRTSIYLRCSGNPQVTIGVPCPPGEMSCAAQSHLERNYLEDKNPSLTEKKAGKVVITGTVRLSADGKTRTTTLHMTDPTGKKITSTMVYDKQ